MTKPPPKPERRRSLDAAVLRPGDPGADKVARVVPDDAEEVRVGEAVLGYVTKGKAGAKKLSLSRSAKRRDEVELVVLCFRRDEDWRANIYVVAHTLAVHAIAVARQNSLDGNVNLAACARTVAGGIVFMLATCPVAEADAAADEAVADPHRLSAKQVATALEIPFRLRHALGLQTIGACDMSRAKWMAESGRLRAERERRRSGAVSREEYVAGSVSAACKALGISRKTYYARLKKGLNPATGELLDPAYSRDAPVTLSSSPEEPYSRHAPVTSPAAEQASAKAGLQVRNARVRSTLPAAAHLLPLRDADQSQLPASVGNVERRASSPPAPSPLVQEPRMIDPRHVNIARWLERTVDATGSAPLSETTMAALASSLFEVSRLVAERAVAEKEAEYELLRRQREAVDRYRRHLASASAALAEHPEANAHIELAVEMLSRGVALSEVRNRIVAMGGGRH